jgi:hypothetical protein
MQSLLRRHSLCLLALVTLGIATTITLQFQPYRFLFLDFHPHSLGSLGAMDFKGKTEADFNRAFGCPGRLVKGSRTPGTPYKVEWSDDVHWVQMSFDADGKWVGLASGPFFSTGPNYIQTPYDRFMLWLRRMGFDVR